MTVAPAVGFEPTTNRLTADRSTTELRWNDSAPSERRNVARVIVRGKNVWLRGRDLNPRPSGYEPDELPGCSTPRRDENTVSKGASNASSKQSQLRDSSRTVTVDDAR